MVTDKVVVAEIHMQILWGLFSALYNLSLNKKETFQNTRPLNGSGQMNFKTKVTEQSYHFPNGKNIL